MPCLHYFILVRSHPGQSLFQHHRRRSAEHRLTCFKAYQDIDAAARQVYVGWQVVLFPQFYAVLVAKSVFGRHALIVSPIWRYENWWEIAMSDVTSLSNADQ